MRRVRRGARRAAGLCGGAAAGLCLIGGTVLAGAGAASADPPYMTPVGGSGQMQVHGVASVDDVLHTDKDFIVGGGDVRATTSDGVHFHYFRLTDGVRHPMLRSPEICVPPIPGAPDIPCHAVLFDDLRPVY